MQASDKEPGREERTKNNALLARLSRKGKVKEFDGGQAIVQEIEYS